MESIGIKVLGWVAEKLSMLVAGWWLSFLRKRIGASIVLSDFELRVVTGEDPLKLRLGFKLHNRTGSTVAVKRVALHLFADGAPVGSVVGDVIDTPFATVSDERVKSGHSVEVSGVVVPDFWYWLRLYSGFSLLQSSIELATPFGLVRVSVRPDRMHADVEGREKQVRDYVDSIRRACDTRH